MANLLWKQYNKTKNLLATPFRTEEEFETFIFKTPEILEDIFLLERQVRGGRKSGIPDIIGIDNDGKICIIEMKNVEVDALIIPQVLQYAFWAEQNPADIKNLWLENENKPEDLEIDWEDNQIRIIIIAPSILPSTLNLVKKINYQVDLIEINRWIEKKNQILLVKKLEVEEKKVKVKPISGLKKYNKDHYLKDKNKESVKHYFKYIAEVEKIVKRKKWNLEKKLNKHYCGFKAGFFNAFGIKWIGSATFAFFFKLSEREAKKIKIPMTKYNRWKEAVYYIEPNKTKTSNFNKLFELAYNKLSGE